MTPIDRLRAICLALPEAQEKETWDAPTFRVRDKIFAMVHRFEGEASLWCKAPPGVQPILVEAAPDRFFRPPYVGSKGWIGIRLTGAVDWEELAALIRRSWSMTAPKRLQRSAAAESASSLPGSELASRHPGTPTARSKRPHASGVRTGRSAGKKPPPP